MKLMSSESCWRKDIISIGTMEQEVGLIILKCVIYMRRIVYFFLPIIDEFQLQNGVMFKLCCMIILCLFVE